MNLEGWNTVIKAATALGAIATVVFGIVQYTDFRKLELEKRQREVEQKALEAAALDRQSKAKFLDKQFEKYVEAVSITGRLATHVYTAGEEVRIEADIEAFWHLYWAELGMVEDRQVALAMVRFGDTLTKLDPSASAQGQAAVRNQLKLDALNLSHCVSKSLEKSWNVKLDVGACA